MVLRLSQRYVPFHVHLPITPSSLTRTFLTDVGGGSVADDTLHSLSNISLRWMVRQVVLSQVGIMFDADALTRANIPSSVFTGAGFPLNPSACEGGQMQTTLKFVKHEDPFMSPSLKLHVPGTDTGAVGGSDNKNNTNNDDASEILTAADAVQPIHDELKKNWLWWILEVVPLSYSYQDGKGVWHTKFGYVLRFERRGHECEYVY